MAMLRYRDGDRVFALVPQPDVVLSLTCRGATWSASVYDFAKKQLVASDDARPNCESAKRFVLDAVKSRYGVGLADVNWREAPGGRSDGPQG